MEDGTQAAELAALSLLAQLSDALGDDLSRLVRTLRLGFLSPAALTSSTRARWRTVRRTCW